MDVDVEVDGEEDFMAEDIVEDMDSLGVVMVDLDVEVGEDVGEDVDVDGDTDLYL